MGARCCVNETGYPRESAIRPRFVLNSFASLSAGPHIIIKASQSETESAEIIAEEPIKHFPSLRGAKRRSNPHFPAARWIASLRSQRRPRQETPAHYGFLSAIRVRE